MSNSVNSVKVLLKMLEDLKEESLSKKINVIAKTDNPTLSRYFLKIGMEELTFEECKKKYENFTNLYLKMSPKNEEDYSGKKFYIKKSSI